MKTSLIITAISVILRIFILEIIAVINEIINRSTQPLVRWEHFQIRSKLRFSINHSAIEINNNHLVLVIFVFRLVVYSHWPSPEPGRMGCMALCIRFHSAPEQRPGIVGYVPIFQVLKLFQVVF